MSARVVRADPSMVPRYPLESGSHVPVPELAFGTMDAVLEKLDGAQRTQLRRAAMPDFTPPMLATLTKQVFSDSAWVYEPKLDGQRSLLWRRGGDVPAVHRNEKDRTSHYPDLNAAILRDETPPLIADGEIVVFDG